MNNPKFKGVELLEPTEVISYHGYRTKFVRHASYEEGYRIDVHNCEEEESRRNREIVEGLQRKLSKLAGRSFRDNHESYKYKAGDRELAVTFSDGNAYFGHRHQLYDW